MNPHITEWLNLLVRWLHVIAGVAWIGASFYFVWLENNLERNKDGLPDDIAGDLWAIHGGGFYYLRKFKVAPSKLPEHLHWFKWEAYFTWITGVLLLGIVYYMNASVFMVDKAVLDISSGAAIGIGIGALVVGWVVYDVLCRTPLLKKPTLMLFTMFAFLTACAYGMSQVLTARAAYIHVGAMIGTMMAGNVLMVIIPGQRRLVAAAEKGEAPDPWQGEYAGLRSRHNNYFTLPVLIIMVSSHFPSTYGNEHGWAVLAALAAVSVAVRHHFNVRHKTNKWAWTMPLALLTIVALAWFTAPETAGRGKAAGIEGHPPVSYAEAKNIIASRCVSCHSATPSDDVFTIAPVNAIFDTDQQIQTWAERMKVRCYDVQTMPFGNKTNMTEEERVKLAAWVVQGAKLE